MSENTLADTVGSWFDTTEERRSGAIGVGIMAGVLGISQAYSAIENLYPDDAVMVSSALGLGVLGIGVGGVYMYGKKAGQRQEPIIIDPDEIREVVERVSDDVEDDVEDGIVEDVEMVSDDVLIDGTKPLSRHTLSDRKDFDGFQNKLQEATHIYVNATSGSGKSVLVNAYLQQDLGQDSKFIVLDPKPEGVANLKWSGAYKVVNDPSKFEEVLERVVGIMEKRQLNSHIENPLLTVVIDEFSALNEGSVEYVSKLLGLARSSNIKLVMISQTTSASFNGLAGKTDLFNGVTIISLGFNERHERVVSFAKISSGKLRKIGEDIVVPELPVPWMEAVRPFEDDSKSFGFIVDDMVNVTEITPIPPTNVSNADAITKFAMMLSEKSGVDLSGVVEEYNSEVSDELPPMLKPRTKEDENKYNFQPPEHNDKENPSLRLTAKIMCDSDLSDSGLRIGKDTIVTSGDVACIKFLNKWFNGNDPDGNHRREMCEITFNKYSPYHFKVIEAVLSGGK